MTNTYARCACCAAPTSIPADPAAFAYCETCSLLGHWQHTTRPTAHAVRVSCGY